MSALVRVAVYRDTETLHTYVDRDHDGTYYEIPEPLVVAYEEAQKAYRDAQAAITTHIDERHLQEQSDW